MSAGNKDHWGSARPRRDSQYSATVVGSQYSVIVVGSQYSVIVVGSQYSVIVADSRYWVVAVDTQRRMGGKEAGPDFAGTVGELTGHNLGWKYSRRTMAMNQCLKAVASSHIGRRRSTSNNHRVQRHLRRSRRTNTCTRPIP